MDPKEDPALRSRQPFVGEDIKVQSVDSSSDGNPSPDGEKHLDSVLEKSISPDVHAVNLEKLQGLSAQLGDNVEGLAPKDDVEMVMDKIDAMTVPEARVILEQLLIDHKYDYNFAIQTRTKIEHLLEGPQASFPLPSEQWEFELKCEAAVNRYYSPYPEVRAVATPNDDPTVPCETIRAHLLGYIWAVIGQFVNSFFYSRYPNITLSSAVAQILLYPCGKLLARLPNVTFTIFGNKIELNPGPWTYKEQMLSTIIFNVSLSQAYVFLNIQTQTVYYKDRWLTTGYEMLLLLSTQLLGLGVAGILRRFVVYPIETFWPSILPTLALNRALLVPERKEDKSIHGWTISRYNFFFLAFAAMFLYFWLPDYLFNVLSLFAWMTWIAPDNFNLNIVTGSSLGLGFNPISSFDWNIVSGPILLPLAYPFYSTIQQYSGMIMGGLVTLAIYYSNTANTAYYQPNSPAVFDHTGSPYNISKVVANGVLDEVAYQQYSPAFYTAGNLVSFGAFFAFYPFTFVFVLLDSWRPISRAFRKMSASVYSQTKTIVFSFARAAKALVRGRLRECGYHLTCMSDKGGSVYDGFDDPFTNLMRNYAEVPDWWFLAIGLIAFIFALVILTQFPDLETPVWTIFFAIALNLVFLLPMTYLNAMAGTTEGLNVITELVIGYALPGRPEALMFVKAYGYNINGQADNYTSDQKMGLYAKIPPRAMFRGQIISTIICCFVCYGVVNFVDSSIEGICTPDQPQRFSCTVGSQVFFSSSVVWGLIGPEKVFDQIYPSLKYTFLFGFLLAIVWWTVKRFGYLIREWSLVHAPSMVSRPLDVLIFKPLSWLKNFHPSLFFNGMLTWGAYNLTYTTSGVYIAAFFMYYLKRYKTAWWEKYTYVLSAALTGGVAFSAIIIFFAVQYHAKDLNWWGNLASSGTIDGGAGQTALLPLPDSGFFGPATWT